MAYFLLIRSLIAEISLTQACRSRWDMDITTSRSQWKWYATNATSLKMFSKG